MVDVSRYFADGEKVRAEDALVEQRLRGELSRLAIGVGAIDVRGNVVRVTPGPEGEMQRPALIAAYVHQALRKLHGQNADFSVFVESV